MSELPYDPIDELLHRAHNDAHGAPPSFKGRLRARMAAETTVRKQTRLMFIKLGVGIAALLVLGVAIGMNTHLFLPEPEQTQPQARTNEPATPATSNTPAPENNQPAIDEQPAPEPEPEPAPEPKPEPKPTPETQPDDQIEEKPTPETPEQPQPKPEPQPVEPDDVVEEPAPKPAPEVEPSKPESTEVKPESTGAVVLATRLGDAKFEVRYGQQDWEDFTDQELREGISLKAGRDAVDLQLNGGGRARFNGEVVLTTEGSLTCFILADDSLYVDNLNTGEGVLVLGKGHTAAMGDGAGVFYATHLALEVVCLGGNVTLDDENVMPGFSRRANKRGVGDAKPFQGDRFLKGIPERSLIREDFDAPPAGGMYQDGERLENGVAIMDQEPRYLAFNFEPEAAVLPGMVLRFRYRTTDITKLELELFETGEIKLLKRTQPRLFKHIWMADKTGEWQTLELRVEEIANRDDQENFPTHGDLLRNFKLHYQGGEKAKLEIDWVEFVRTQD
ncbi:MAG: hypothetical protein KDB68_08005 [Planctomycetes bacterium]|nr:hypothetical protein [Planctomycetota bacterium]